jgi:type I restriction enzyme S subunit
MSIKTNNEISQTSTVKRVPALRFPGFSGEWEEKRLREVSAKPTYGMNARSKQYDGKNIYLRITDIDEKTGQLKRSALTSPDGKLEDEYRLKEGDLLFTRTGASVGKTYLYKKPDGILYFAGFLIKFSIDKANPYFVYLLTLQKKYWKWIESVSMRSGQPGVNAQEYSELKLNLPALPEQQKIAEFLGLADAWIENLRAQKTSLESYKKAIMQKLFSQELRFKNDDGQDFPDWTERKLGELGKFISGQGFSDKEQGGVEGVPFYKVSDMNSDGNEEEMTSANHYVTDEQIKRLKYNVITEKSLIFAKVGAAIFLERKRLAQNYILDNNMMAFIPIGNIAFLRHIFTKIRLSKYAQIGALPSYNASDISIIRVPVPVSEVEQKKITDFLTSIDQKIASKQKQITQAEQWKRGLMQGLFV